METECTEKRQTQVSQQCQRLSELSTELSNLISKLEKRLEAILAPAAPRQVEETKHAEELCKLAQALRVLGDVKSSHLVRLDNLISRIEI